MFSSALHELNYCNAMDLNVRSLQMPQCVSLIVMIIIYNNIRDHIAGLA